jgi:hypothetical protein
MIRIELYSVRSRCIMTYEKENQETIRERDTRRSHQRDDEAESGDVCTRAQPHVSE